MSGIPFAAPPVGPLRWRPPVSPAAWEEVRTRDTYAPDAMQVFNDGEPYITDLGRQPDERLPLFKRVYNQTQ